MNPDILPEIIGRRLEETPGRRMRTKQGRKAIKGWGSVRDLLEGWGELVRGLVEALELDVSFVRGLADRE